MGRIGTPPIELTGVTGRIGHGVTGRMGKPSLVELELLVQPSLVELELPVQPSLVELELLLAELVLVPLVLVPVESEEAGEGCVSALTDRGRPPAGA